MARSRWEEFIEWARRARAKPAFDREERDYRLAVAGAVRELIEAADADRPLAEPTVALVARVRARRETLVPARLVGELAAWAEADPRRLAPALRVFSSAPEDPVASLERFMATVASDPGGARLAHGGAQIGALLNFGASPDRVPAVPLARYARLGKLLGEEPGRADSPVALYRSSLALAQSVDAALRRAGVPVRDMVDVDSLITICATQEELWAGGGDAADSRRKSEPDVYLAVCMIYRNEADYLAEWIEFHRLVGAERFYLYDNESDDQHLDVLAPYVDDGLVVRHEWPGSSTTGAELNAIQKRAYEHCVSTYAEEARWIAVIDADEFLFSPTGKPVSELLERYEPWPAVAVNTRRFGPGAELEGSGGLVIERHTILDDTWGGKLVKSIVDPAAVTRCINSHRFEPRRGATVDENAYPVFHHTTQSRSHERLQINHYLARATGELHAKHGRRITDRHAYAHVVPGRRSPEPRAEDRDEAILVYVPRLREALRRRAAVPSG